MSGVESMQLVHPAGSTAIVAGVDALQTTVPQLRRWIAGRTVFVLSTERILGLHGAALESLRPAAGRWVTFEVPDGEEAKQISEAESLWRQMLAAGGKRDSRLIAFGGGTVGDLGGFVAGCFLRGIEFMQLPTTLLAQVDAALGGKTGVDLPAGKNTVGLFHHPAWVISETRFLATLSRAEMRSGLVEVIKMAMLLDPALLDRVESDLDLLQAGDAVALGPVVAAAARAKIVVVEADPTEQGERRLLNFGHTLGHAIEATLGYRGLRHGEAVAHGLLFALQLAGSRGLADRDAARLRRLIERLAPPPLPALEVENLLARMRQDKKATEGGLAWVLPASVGAGRIVTDLAEQDVRAELERFLSPTVD